MGKLDVVSSLLKDGERSGEGSYRIVIGGRLADDGKRPCGAGRWFIDYGVCLLGGGAGGGESGIAPHPGLADSQNSSWSLQAAPRCLQDVPRCLQDASKTPQDAPRCAQGAPKCLQDASKTPPRCPKTSPRCPKTPPRHLQDAPRCLQDAPRCPKMSQDALKMAQDSSKMAKMAQDTP